MELRCLGEAVVKSRTTPPPPLLFLYPSFARPVLHQHRHRHPQTPSHNLSTTCSRRADADNVPSDPKFTYYTTALGTSNSRISQLLRKPPKRPGQRSSADILEESYANRPRNQRVPQGSIFAQAERGLAESEKESTPARMAAAEGVPSKPTFPQTLRPFDPLPYSPSRSIYNPYTNDGGQPLPLEPATPVERTIKSSPTVGRTIRVRKGDVGTALRLLNRLCTQESIPQDMKSQKFHERAGMKRKRLRRVRHKIRFKHAFKATVERVKEMRRKGW